MKLIIKPEAEAVADWVADHIAERIRQRLQRRQGNFVLSLPTGSSPLLTYQRLIKKYQSGRLSFEEVTTFNLDEYVGLDSGHPQSYQHFMEENLFSQVDLKPGNINFLDGMAEDLWQECWQYEQKIGAAGGIDLLLGGVGEDGHIAFNEPGSSLASRTRVEYLTEDTRQANKRFFADNLKQVPSAALTMGVATILEAREVVIIATGHRKARSVQQAIEGGVSQICTVSALQLHPQAVMVVDEAACSELKVATYNYFLAGSVGEV